MFRRSHVECIYQILNTNQNITATYINKYIIHQGKISKQSNWSQLVKKKKSESEIMETWPMRDLKQHPRTLLNRHHIFLYHFYSTSYKKKDKKPWPWPWSFLLRIVPCVTAYTSGGSKFSVWEGPGGINLIRTNAVRFVLRWICLASLLFCLECMLFGVAWGKDHWWIM